MELNHVSLDKTSLNQMDFSFVVIIIAMSIKRDAVVLEHLQAQLIYDKNLDPVYQVKVQKFEAYPSAMSLLNISPIFVANGEVRECFTELLCLPN